MRHADFIVAEWSRWLLLLLHPNRAVYQSFNKCVRVNNSPDGSWQDTR